MSFSTSYSIILKQEMQFKRHASWVSGTSQNISIWKCIKTSSEACIPNYHFYIVLNSRPELGKLWKRKWMDVASQLYTRPCTCTEEAADQSITAQATIPGFAMAAHMMNFKVTGSLKHKNYAAQREHSWLAGRLCSWDGTSEGTISMVGPNLPEAGQFPQLKLICPGPIVPRDLVCWTISWTKNLMTDPVRRSVSYIPYFLKFSRS